MTEREKAEILELASEYGASEVSSALIVIVIIWIVIGWLVPAVVAMQMMSTKGQSRGIGFIMGLGLSWIGVIIVACKPNLKVSELSSVPPPVPFSTPSPPPLAISAPSSSPPPLPAESVLPHVEEREQPNFRLEAIRKLKAAGVVFDEYDIELEIGNLRSKHQKVESLRRANLDRERVLESASPSAAVPPPLPFAASSSSTLPLLSTSAPSLSCTKEESIRAREERINHYRVLYKASRLKEERADLSFRIREEERELKAITAGVASFPSLSPPPLSDSHLEKLAQPDFRVEAILKLKSAGVSFDEFDIEFEIENLRAAHLRTVELKHEEESKFLRTREEVVFEFLRARRETEELRHKQELAELRAKEASERNDRERRKTREKELEDNHYRIGYIVIFVVVLLVFAFLIL
jgi:hypothetical protein